MHFTKLLIFRIGHLGDTVVALPALWTLRQALPSSNLVLLTNINSKNPHYISARNVLPEKGLIDGYIEYPSETTWIDRSLSIIRLAAAIRRHRFDAVVYLMPRIRSNDHISRDKLFFAASGIQKLLGINFLQENRLDLSAEHPASIDSESDFLLNLIRSEGFNVGVQHKTDLLISPAESYSAQQTFKKVTKGMPHGAKLVAIAPGSKWPSKIWGENNYAEVVKRLIETDNCYPVILGGKEDEAIGNRLLSVWQSGANLAGLLSVRESAAILMQCDLYLGNDTGTMHLAGAVGTPCVAIFAAIDVAGRWNPFGNENIIFRKFVECEKCMTPDCFNNNLCLKLVTVEEVYKACSSRLASTNKSTRSSEL